MSDEEQFSMLGRLSLERANLRRKHALVAHHVSELGEAMYEAAVILMRQNNRDLTGGLAALDNFLRLGGMERLQESIIEHREMEHRLADIDKTMRDAGAE